MEDRNQFTSERHTYYQCESMNENVYGFIMHNPSLLAIRECRYDVNQAHPNRSIDADVQRINNEQKAEVLIRQLDVGRTGYTITRPGVYQLAEDIVFDPNPVNAPAYRRDFLNSSIIASVEPPPRCLLSYCTSYKCSDTDLLALKDVQCSICCCDLAELNVTITALPCLHQYHQTCITAWFEHKSNCPLCRHTVNDCD